MPIEVPVGNMCWGCGKDIVICEHFSNEGGHPICGLSLDWKDSGGLKYTVDGVPKPDYCNNLKIPFKKPEWTGGLR